ncbi:aminopeptidase [Paenibacillus endoradicis]|uniref:aminopeptidase n=1 Tax=Paenibacillus endoradicis TaxID=2972487 RepID=UPI0021595605|nr:aminopeptidase [Paenibacillus endoradicis]MCR8656783.1 aminopeptidase [Paenibacillus endoradicis]
MMKLSNEIVKQLAEYAKLIVTRGVSLERNQLLVVTCSSDTLYFAKIVASAGYAAGAGDVQIRLEDEGLNALRNQYATEEQLLIQYRNQSSLNEQYIESKACFVRLIAPTDDVIALTDERELLLSNIVKSIRKPSLIDQFAFVVRRQASPVATIAWAEKVFPLLHGEEAFAKLWETIFHITYCNSNNSIESWDKHIATLLSNKAKLNALDIKKLIFINELGTNLEVELADNNQWFGGNCFDIEGKEFYPSIPTEEIFAAPHRLKVTGVVYNSIPLYLNNECIDGFQLTFSGGEVTSFDAKVGKKHLAALLATDEGARRLGEVALVHNGSRLAEQNLLFYETLCDENRTCHIALGAGYPGCIVDTDRSRNNLLSKGLNQSAIHVDFMFGTPDMIVTALLANGEEKVIMNKGEYNL